ncbi:MAG: putative lysyl-tRNA synthetase [Marmoricola sp.]|nr:putative lysyl-tRNA synthetase [Marmoricola sp.]
MTATHDTVEMRPGRGHPPGTQARRAGASPAPLDDRWPDRCAAVMWGFAALVLVVAVVEPWRDYMERPNDPISALTIPIVPSPVYAALLVAMAVALRRRLRAAWWLLLLWWLVLPDVVRVVDLARGTGTWFEAVGLVVAGAAIVVLVRVRWQFTARHTPGNVVRAAAIFIVGGAVVLAVGSWLVMVFGRTGELGDAVFYTLSALLSDLGSHSLVPEVHAPMLVHLSIGLLGAGVFLWATSVLFRPPRELTSPSIEDEARLHAMVRDFGEHDSLGYFATRRDKVVVWDTGNPSTARAGISHRVVGSVSLASGNPLGDPRHWDEAIARWRDNARTKGLSIAVMGAGEAGAAAYVKTGLTALDIGDEAILDVGALSLGGVGSRTTRQSVTRLRRRGYTTSVVRHEALGPSDFSQLGASATAWRGDGGDERGFSMALGRLGDPLDGECVMVRSHDSEGHLRGFLSFVPWGRNGLSLDLMRRDPTGDNGLVELMIAGLVERSGVLGLARVSLNFAMFREAFERGAELGAGPVARLWRRALVLASRTWQLESLYRSNAKYRPTWQPRFICFEYTSDLPRVGTAAGSAEGFLTRPSIGRLWGRATTAEVLGGVSQTHADRVRALVPPPVDNVEEALSARRLPEQVRVRRDKVERLRAQGVDPYPVTYPRTHTLAQVRSEAGDIPADTPTGCRVCVTGRVMRKRDLGGLGYASLRDGTGDLQVMVDARDVGAELHQLWRRDIDLGDHVGVTGEVITTRRGELSVRADSITLTSKSLRPLPDKHQGLSDPETRLRQRHLDLIVRPQARQMARTRSTVVRSLRDSLHARGFLEVETPVLQLVHGGANARPFQTHVNAYDLDMYLRIATELHLKRLVVGGMEQVFEIGRQFRNEGADSRHNPEFTSLEVYEAYRDYDDMRLLTQSLIQEAATAVYGAPVARRTDADGRTEEFDLSGDWPVRTVCRAVSDALGCEITPDTPLRELRSHARRTGIETDTASTWGFLLEAIYGQLCESTVTTPVFFTDFPKENAPLTRQHRADPRLAEKWDLVMFGSEQGTAYSELIDPFEQRRRLVAQSLLAAAGDPEAMQVDEDFLQALEYGMPPTGGMGLGVDRLVMNLTGGGIRDTILFPIVRPNR